MLLDQLVAPGVVSSRCLRRGLQRAQEPRAHGLARLHFPTGVGTDRLGRNGRRPLGEQLGLHDLDVDRVLQRPGQVAGGLGREDQPVVGALVGVEHALAQRAHDRRGHRVAHAHVLGGEDLETRPHHLLVLAVGAGKLERGVDRLLHPTQADVLVQRRAHLVARDPVDRRAGGERVGRPVRDGPVPLLGGLGGLAQRVTSSGSRGRRNTTPAPFRFMSTSSPRCTVDQRATRPATISWISMRPRAAPRQ
jgi:hypothetical protein